MRVNVERSLLIGLTSLLTLPGIGRGQDSAVAQTAPARAPIIRAIVINRSEVFDSVEARGFWGFGLVNALHAETRPYVDTSRAAVRGRASRSTRRA